MHVRFMSRHSRIKRVTPITRRGIKRGKERRSAPLFIWRNRYCFMSSFSHVIRLVYSNLHALCTVRGLTQYDSAKVTQA